MDKMADVLGRAGAWCGQNKYLSAIKNAFQNFMPLTIAGAIGVMKNIGVNDVTGDMQMQQLDFQTRKLVEIAKVLVQKNMKRWQKNVSP